MVVVSADKLAIIICYLQSIRQLSSKYMKLITSLKPDYFRKYRVAFTALNNNEKGCI